MMFVCVSPFFHYSISQFFSYAMVHQEVARDYGNVEDHSHSYLSLKPFFVEYLERLMFHQMQLDKCCLFSLSIVSGIVHMVNHSLPLCSLGEYLTTRDT